MPLCPTWARRTVAALMLFVIVVAARPVAAQVKVTVVMKSGVHHTGENPNLSESGEFALRRKSERELRATAAEIAYVDFVTVAHTAPQLGPSQQAVVLRSGKVVKGRLVEMAHVMHDDETSDYVVIFRSAEGEALRLLDRDVARVYFSPASVAR